MMTIVLRCIGWLHSRALHNRASFIKDSKESYLLYFWELIDGHGLLAFAIQKLNDQVSAANRATGVPTVVF
jgi:hypothetical protein